MKEALKNTYFNNSGNDYLIAASIIIIGFIIVGIIKKLTITKLKKLSQKSETPFDDIIVLGIEKFAIPPLYFVSIYFGVHYLELTAKLASVVNNAFIVVVTYFVLRLVSSIIFYLLKNYVRKQSKGEEKIKQLGGLMIVVNVIIWVIGLLFLFDNMGYNVTAVITGLGIGGIAVALAAQNILGDLFNYFVIFFDRPFEIGDFIIIDDKMGAVDYIGIKTTRIKSLTGEQLIMANSDLTKSRIHNYKRMERRRIQFNINVSYETPIEHIRRIPQILKTAVEKQKEVLFDRAHFASYTSTSLNFEVVYFVLNADFNKYMDIQQGINLYIFEEFNRLDIDFAIPVQSLYVKKFTPSEFVSEEKNYVKEDKINPNL